MSCLYSGERTRSRAPATAPRIVNVPEYREA